MNPIVFGALIAAGSTGAVGVVGILANMRTATSTLHAGRSAQIWDRRAVVYEEILADAVARRVRRDHVTSNFRFDPATEAEIRARITPAENTGWYEFEGRVLAMASPEVHDAFEAARGAHLDVLAAVRNRQEAAEENRTYLDVNPGTRPPVDLGAISREIRKVQKEANAADDRLTHFIRTELLAASAGSRRGPRFGTRRVRLDDARHP